MTERNIPADGYARSNFALSELLRPEDHFLILELPDAGKISPIPDGADSTMDLATELLVRDKEPPQSRRHLHVMLFLLP